MFVRRFASDQCNGKLVNTSLRSSGGTTTIGAEGWGFTNGEQVLIADSPADFADAVVRLYNDNALWQKLSDGGYRHIAEHNTPEVIGKIINDSVKRLIEAG